MSGPKQLCFASDEDSIIQVPGRVGLSCSLALSQSRKDGDAIQVSRCQDDRPLPIKYHTTMIHRQIFVLSKPSGSHVPIKTPHFSNTVGSLFAGPGFCLPLPLLSSPFTVTRSARRSTSGKLIGKTPPTIKA